VKRFALALLLPLFACSNELPPIGQLVLHVDTDAPVPPALGQSLSRSDPQPLFDSIRIEVFEPGATTPCAGCTREFAIDAGKFAKGDVSIGIPGKPGVSGYRARVTLFLEEWVYPCTLIPDAERAQTDACNADPTASAPHPATVLQSVVALPPVVDGVVTDVSVLLETESVGQPQGALDAPIDVTPGNGVPSAVGLWPGAARNNCSTAARPGEVCIPSGAFWQGNARVSLWEQRAFTPHLVVVSPFFLKTTEVTVEECRSVPLCDTYTTQTVIPNGACDYTHTPSAVSDKRAVNCVLTPAKMAYCAAWGGELPTLAQLEYAGRGTVGSIYVWGNDDPTCEDAMFLRASEQDFVTQESCWVAGDKGPFVPGRGKRDRLDMPTGTVVDLAGNMSECARDAYDGTCDQPWPPGVLYDPVANVGKGYNALMGGNWQDGALGMALNGHGCIPPDFVSIEYGFRCSRPDQ
jgi:formylglycine-generating enzyme required for sulfatase activity